MIYFLWQTGRFTNQKISGLFGLSYASVSRRVAIFREKLRVDKTFKKEYDRISALIKMCDPKVCNYEGCPPRFCVSA